MRNHLRRTHFLLALFVATLLLSSDVFSAEPAGAVNMNRRPMTVSSKAIARKRAVSKARYNRAPRRRTSRAAVRPKVVPTGDVWAKLRACESGGRYNISTGNGFYGAYQFHPRTWRGLGFPGLPHQAPPEMQDEAARKLQARSGWGQWPACSRRLRLR
jgi:resuscitation-promoting factor RpfB